MDQDSRKKGRPSILLRAWHNVRRTFLAGLLVVVPLWMTYAALKFFFRILDGFFGRLVRQWLGFPIPGLGFVLLLIFVYGIGMVSSNILGRSLVHFGESVLHRIPLVKHIYQASKQMIQTVSRSTSFGFKRVVLVEYPRPGLLAVGFVTNMVHDERTRGQSLVVFIPTTPNPTSGVFEIVPEREVMECTLSIEDGIKMVMSGGLVLPENFVIRKGMNPSS